MLRGVAAAPNVLDDVVDTAAGVLNENGELAGCADGNELVDELVAPNENAGLDEAAFACGTALVDAFEPMAPKELVAGVGCPNTNGVDPADGAGNFVKMLFSG